jgi:hypothetical protein
MSETKANLQQLACDYIRQNYMDFNYWFDLDDISTLEEHNDSFRAQDSEEQLLPILFDIPAEGKGEFMTTAQISERLVTYGNIKKTDVRVTPRYAAGTAGI